MKWFDVIVEFLSVVLLFCASDESSPAISHLGLLCSSYSKLAKLDTGLSDVFISHKK
jgi:hypothetical protein